MYAYQAHDLTIENKGSRIFGRIFMPERVEKCPAIILSHGYNGCHADFDAECRYYASHGYVAYALDFCGGSTRSRSSGATTEMTLFTQRNDLLAVFDHISGMQEVDAQNVFLMGGSQGGLVTALAAAERPDAVRGMILYFPAVDIPANWRSRYPDVSDVPEVTDFWGMQLGRSFFVSMHDYDPRLVIGGYKGRVLLITGDQDPIVSLESVRQTAACYARAELVVLRGEGHGFTPAGNKTAMERTLALMEGLCETAE